MRTAINLSSALTINMVLLALFNWLAPGSNLILNVVLGTADPSTKNAALVIGMLLGFINSVTLAALEVFGRAEDLSANK